MDEGFDFDTDIDSIFTSIESLSMIYISKNRGNIVFAQNNFEKNIAMFGGAITIDAPDFS